MPSTEPGGTPLIPPTSPALLDALAFPASAYGERFIDLAFWRPYVERIAYRHGLPAGEIGMGEPGSFPTFVLNRVWVVKLFSDMLDGLRSWVVEREAATLIHDAGRDVPIPRVIAAGVLSREPAWRYLVTRFVPGEPFAAARPRLDAATRRNVASALGGMIRRVHDLAIPARGGLDAGWGGWAGFVDGQRRGVVERHRAWGTLPERLLGEIDASVAGYRVPDGMPPSLIHADLHEHHLIGGPAPEGWKIRGVIDWGDARTGDRFYELPALHLGLFHGDRAMLRAFLEGYGWPDHRSAAFVRRATTMTLLHEFNVLETVAPMVDRDAIASLDDLATALWRV